MMSVHAQLFNAIVAKEVAFEVEESSDTRCGGSWDGSTWWSLSTIIPQERSSLVSVYPFPKADTKTTARSFP